MAIGPDAIPAQFAAYLDKEMARTQIAQTLRNGVYRETLGYAGKVQSHVSRTAGLLLTNLYGRPGRGMIGPG